MASAPDRDIVPTPLVAQRPMAVLANCACDGNQPDRACAGEIAFARRWRSADRGRQTHANF